MYKRDNLLRQLISKGLNVQTAISKELKEIKKNKLLLKDATTYQKLESIYEAHSTLVWVYITIITWVVIIWEKL